MEQRKWYCPDSGTIVRLVTAEAGESGGVLGVDRGSGLATAATTEVATGTTLTTLTTTAATAAATLAAAATTSTTGTIRLDITRVEVNGLLDLALTLTDLLAASGSEVLLLVVLEGLGVLPLLVELATLVGGTKVEVAETELLLGLLGKVVGVGDALVLRLSGGLVTSSILDESLLLIGVGNSLGSLLVLQLGLTLLGTPRGVSLLVGNTTALSVREGSQHHPEGPLTQGGRCETGGHHDRGDGQSHGLPMLAIIHNPRLAPRVERGRRNATLGRLTTTDASTRATARAAVSWLLIGTTGTVAVTAYTAVTEGYGEKVSKRVQQVRRGWGSAHSKSHVHLPPSLPLGPRRLVLPRVGAAGPSVRLLVRVEVLSTVLTGTTGFSSPSSSLPAGHPKILGQSTSLNTSHLHAKSARQQELIHRRFGVGREGGGGERGRNVSYRGRRTGSVKGESQYHNYNAMQSD